MLASYHVHSTYSDGHNTVAELVEAATAAGIDELGISDHYVLPEGADPIEWSMDLDRLPEYLLELRDARDAAGKRVRLRLGIEADYSPKTVETLAEILGSHELDYVIGAVHYLDSFPVDAHAAHWDVLKQSERNDLMRLYWSRITSMARTGLFQFAAHLDLCKKFGHSATIDLTPDISSALDAIAESGMAVEVNTAGLFMPVREAYPSAAILSECHRRSIPVLVNTDAHTTGNLARGFEEGFRLITQAGYRQRATFAGRQMTLVPL